jgi:hypothetical protein
LGLSLTFFIQKKAARDTLKAEEARIQLRQMDLDLAREQTKASLRHNNNERPSLHAYPQQHVQQQQHHPQQVQPPPQQPQQQQQQQQQQSHLTPGPATAHHHPHHPHIAQHPYPYYSLAPVQQQVLARFNYPPPYIQGHHAQPPPSPSVPYPHSAHPLCPPSTEDKQVHRLYRQASPPAVSPVTEEPVVSKKRNRSSISSPNDPSNEPQQEKISHNKVMEALKAKIQRSNNSGPPSPLAASPIRPPSQLENANKKRKSTLPRPVETTTKSAFASASSPSPRSAKPVLPPIDTNLGRTKTATPAAVVSETSSSTSSSSTTTTSNSSHKSKPNSSAGSGQQESPSDHILLNTRRARSLSPPSSTTSTNSLKAAAK